jgi:2'-5' RNA ligase
MRCFIALELEERCRELLRVRITQFHADLRSDHDWPVQLVPPANWHVTVLFFRDLPKRDHDGVWTEVLRSVEAHVWDDLVFPWEDVELWPNPSRPGLICLAAPPYLDVKRWPLIENATKAPLNQGDVAKLLNFRPHITLMRFKGGRARPYSQEWKAMATRIPRVPPTAIRFDRVSLLLSDSSPSRPLYTRAFSAPIRPALGRYAPGSEEASQMR